MKNKAWVDDERITGSYPPFAAVEREDARQIHKWGVQKRSPFEWMTYLTEEVGELAEAISEEHYRGGSRFNIYKEAIHVATLALKIAHMSQSPVREKEKPWPKN